jgi:serine protease Do
VSIQLSNAVRWALCAAVVALSVLGCTGLPAAPSLADATTSAAPSAGAPSAGTPGAAIPGAAGSSVADIVERLEPSVVTVRTDGGLGSGVVYRPDVVITNQHVVGDAREVTIDYADGTSSPGIVLATDRIADLAVIRTARTGLPVPEYRVELPRPGDPVLAIGSPLGFENTVTAGIVSGLDREIPGSGAQSRALVDLIQVDAAISPGNSGGALLDGAGRVIGINEAYIPPSAGAVSLGFAIPAATAVDVAEQLLADGTADHPYLGVSLGRLTPQIRERLGVPAEDGALLVGVEPGGPAAAAGLRAGDVIVGMAGRPVRSVEDVLGVLRDTEPGQQVQVTIARGTGEIRPTVTIGTITG